MTFDIQLQWGVKIPLRDGTHLSATAYLPIGQTPHPAVFVLTPYVGQTHHDQAASYASHGFPFLTVDVRGRGNSNGEFHPINDSKDGYDVVEWLAQQPYCNGKVAMWGGSYMGYTQWATAKACPPHLATIAPVASPFRGVDSPLRNNIFAPYTMAWLTMLSGRTSQDKLFYDQTFWRTLFRRWHESGRAFKKLDTFVGNPSPLFQEWISNPQRGPYWDRFNPTPEQYRKLSIPILTITGHYDGDQPGALAYYQECARYCSEEVFARHYLVMGPWDHAGTRIPKDEFGGLKVGAASVVDLRKLHREWYAWTMQAGPKPEFLKQKVAYYVMVADRWRYADTLEAVTARAEPFFLQSTNNPTSVFDSGMLAAKPPARSEPDRYVYDPRDVSLAELESTIDASDMMDQRMVHARAGRHLVYHTAPFERDTEISGCFKLSVWLSIDCPDTDFRVAVYDVNADGSAVHLSTDWMRARYRESFREANLIKTTEPLRYDFENFMFVSRLIRKGNRLRLIVGPHNSIYFQRNHNSGGVVIEESMEDARPVTVQLFHDEAHPSALYVPIGQP